jgi:RNA polymerase sigma-70 factor (family 1)
LTIECQTLTADNQYNENELLSRMAAGQEDAFERIYQYYNRKIYYYILSVVKFPQLAEDLQQEVFLKLWEGRSQLHEVKHFSAFLFTIARNHSINVLKSAARSHTALGEIIKHAPEPAFDDEILSRDYERFIQKVLLSLPPRTRDIYRKCKEQGRSYSEVARELGISGNAVKRHMINSIKVLRQAATKDLGISRDMAILFFTFLAVAAAQ